MKKTVLLLVLFLGTLALGMAQSKENDFLEQPYIEVTGDKGGKGKSDGLSRGDRSEYKRGYLYQGRALGRDGCPIYVERGS